MIAAAAWLNNHKSARSSDGPGGADLPDWPWRRSWRFRRSRLVAAEGEVVTVRLKEGQSLRDLAAEHLGDPDLWAEILRLNELSVGGRPPGHRAQDPGRARSPAANRALAESLSLIQQATEQGARLFAADRDRPGDPAARCCRGQAQGRRMGRGRAASPMTRKWPPRRRSRSALAQRDATAEALLSDRQGSVEGQRPQDLLWTDRPLDAILIEEEKVRTLSRSTAQITFRDDSRLRLNANSQAVIQRMRVDPLSREEEAKVSLVEGDFYALLAGKSERKSFELEVPEVETEIEVDQFLGPARRQRLQVRQLTTSARSQVSAQGESVSLGRNEATLVRNGAPPSEKIDILPAAALAAPQDDQVAFDADVELSWASRGGCRGLLARGGLRPGFPTHDLQPLGAGGAALPERAARGRLLLLAGRGARQVRSAGRAQRGLALSRADRRRRRPICRSASPAEGGIVRQSPLAVRGESEPDASLELNGSPLEVAADGRFETSYQPSPGPTS